MRHLFAVLALGAILQSLPAAHAATDPDERRTAPVRHWAGVPPATRDDGATRHAIPDHIDELVPALAARARSRQMLQGVVANVDERNDRIALRLTSDVTADFRVQDALIFDSVRYGDPVEITVESIDGTKTIVGLRKR